MNKNKSEFDAIWNGIYIAFRVNKWKKSIEVVTKKMKNHGGAHQTQSLTDLFNFQKLFLFREDK
jgi:penicillin-binding protein-related factor A (putative recombinase)